MALSSFPTRVLFFLLSNYLTASLLCLSHYTTFCNIFLAIVSVARLYWISTKIYTTCTGSCRINWHFCIDVWRMKKFRTYYQMSMSFDFCWFWISLYIFGDFGKFTFFERIFGAFEWLLNVKMRGWFFFIYFCCEKENEENLVIAPEINYNFGRIKFFELIFRPLELLRPFNYKNKRLTFLIDFKEEKKFLIAPK